MLFRAIKKLLWGISLFFLPAGCINNEDPAPAPPDTLYRTVLVYLGVDNNFGHEARMKIDTLWRHWRGDYYGNLLVYADAGKESVLVRIYQDSSGVNLKDTVRVYSVEDSADPAVLKRVLNEVKASWPAQGYGLVVLSHATGWLPDGTMARPRSIIDDQGKQMELRDFAAALPYKLEFILFDACLMGSVEVMYELKDKADFIVASPTEVIASTDQSKAPGFIYTGMMKHLMAPVADLKGVAKEFYDFYNNHPDGGSWRSATVTVTETAKLDTLASLSKSLLQGVDGASLVNLAEIQTYGYGNNYLYTDFGDYIRAVQPQRYDEFTNLLNQCFVYKAHTPGYYSAGNDSRDPVTPITHYSGLSIYVPQQAYTFMNGEYRKLKWVQRVLPYIP
jgi:hypothetical protein